MSGPVRHLGLLLFGSGECLGLFKFRPLSRLQLSLALVTCVDAGVDKTTLCLAQFDAFSAGKLFRFRQQRPAQQRTVVVGTHFPLTYKWSQSVLEDAQGLVLFQPSVQPFPVLDQSLVRQRRLLMTKRGAVRHHQPGIGKLLHQQPTRFLQFLSAGPASRIGGAVSWLYQTHQGLAGHFLFVDAKSRKNMICIAAEGAGQTADFIICSVGECAGHLPAPQLGQAELQQRQVARIAADVG